MGVLTKNILNKLALMGVAPRSLSISRPVALEEWAPVQSCNQLYRLPSSRRKLPGAAIPSSLVHNRYPTPNVESTHNPINGG